MNIFLNLLLWANLLWSPPASPPVAKPHQPVAVIELFTSQGCSSCPPADALLNETIRTANQHGQRVYGLSFHVDYWDRLGWRDPFSQHAFTERQRQYSRQFAGNTVYTPQAVLNGTQEFVGSNQRKLNQLLPVSLQQEVPVTVVLDAPTQNAQKLTVPFHLTGNVAGALLNVALVSKTETTRIERGENEGRTLTHNNVVRVFQTISATANGQASLTLPATFDRANGAIIAYVQTPKTGAVLGADAVELK
jgi:hypothetical protein